MWRSEISRSIYARLYAGWKRVRREVDIIDSILRRAGARRVIEFGCGLGRHSYLLSRRGYEVVLSDIADQRFGVARKLPFVRYDLLAGGSIGSFDAGYAVGVITLFEYRDIVRILRNIWDNIAEDGIFIFDYNFTSYRDPEKVEIRVNGRRYTAILEKGVYKPHNGGLVYEYIVRVIDEKGRVVGVEEASYPIYPRDKIFRAIKEAGYSIHEIVWVSWDPIEYIYKPASEDADSAFIAIKKI
jgi:SAM-dependent methyltransferase